MDPHALLLFTSSYIPAVNRVDFLPLGVEEGVTVLMCTGSQGLTLGITGLISCNRGAVFQLCSPKEALCGRVIESAGSGSRARVPPTTHQPFATSSSPLSRGWPREQKATSSPASPKPRPLSFLTGYKIYLVLLADSLRWCPAWLAVRGLCFFMGV